MEADEYKKYIPAVLGVLLIASFGYTYTISQDIDTFQSEEEINSLISGEVDPVVEDFNSAIETVSSNIESVNSDLNTTQSNVDSLQDRVDTLESENSNLSEALSDKESRIVSLEESLNSTRSELENLSTTVDRIGDVSAEVSGTTDSNVFVDVRNNMMGTVYDVEVTLEFDNSSETKTISELSGEEESTLSFSSGTGEPKVSTDYSYEQ